jgi:hypothetical protein
MKMKILILLLLMKMPELFFIPISGKESSGIIHQIVVFRGPGLPALLMQEIIIMTDILTFSLLQLMEPVINYSGIFRMAASNL